jgi:hypothetical protein
VPNRADETVAVLAEHLLVSFRNFDFFCSAHFTASLMGFSSPRRV